MADIILIAGPCSAESRKQFLSTAEEATRAGAGMLRAGLWKPRTSPYSFDGVGEKGLAWLAEAQRLTGLPVATEVATPDHLRLCIDAGIRCVWLGARTTANPFMVQLIANAISECSQKDITVLVKNPVNPDVAAWHGAIQRLQKTGAKRIIAVHRGFSQATAEMRNKQLRNEPIWSLPLRLKRLMPDIELICDPSHIAGDAALVPVIAQQALDLNFDGLMVEVHCSPEQALSDARQQLSPAQFRQMLASLHRPEHNDTDDAALQACRNEIDEIDSAIWKLILERKRVAKEIGNIKRKSRKSVYQQQRFEQLLNNRLQWAQEHNLPKDVVVRIIEALHEIAIAEQL